MSFCYGHNCTLSLALYNCRDVLCAGEHQKHNKPMLKYGRLNYWRHRFMAWSQKDFWKTTWQSSANLILLGILRLKSASLEDWNVKPLSPTHTRPACLWGSKSPRKPMNQVTAFGSKATHVIASAPKCKYHLILSPSCPAPPWLHHFTVSLSL